MSDHRTRGGTRAPQAPEGTPGGPTRELESYRGVAAVLIVVYHLFQELTTYVGGVEHAPYRGGLAHALLARLELVDVFFVMSAYLLGLPFVRAAVDGRPLRPARVFLLRRAARILPLYYIAVLVVWAWRNPALPGDWRDLIEHLTFTQIFDQKRIFYTIGPTWSLALEVMFYVLLLAGGTGLVRLCGRIEARSRRLLVVAVGVLSLAAVTLAWETVAHYAWHVPDNSWPTYFGPQARLTSFAAGLLVAVVRVGVRGRRVVPAAAAPLLRLAAAGLLALVTWQYQAQAPWAGLYYHDVAGVAFGLLLASTVLGPERQRWQQALSTRPLVWLGLISYSVYTWHEPVFRLLDAHGLLSSSPALFPLDVVLVLAVVLPLAVASYWVIEYPANHLRLLLDERGEPRRYYDA